MTDQIRLADFFKELDARGAKIMLSNSDPRNQDSHDTFFDDLFAGYSIERVTCTAHDQLQRCPSREY